MCDTLIALGNVTADGSVLFAKNTDREPNEAHEVVILPAKDYPAGSRVKTTYIEIPQATHTHSVLLAKPYWMWGIEMGGNEHGVVISNEGTFTHHLVTPRGVLTGMDLNRLALERADTAEKAMEVILSLVEQFGQGGNSGHKMPFYYQNSFAIADRNTAWILEFSGKQWAYRQIKDLQVVSNELTIHREWDRASAGLIDEAVKRFWWRDRNTFDYSKAYSDWLFTHFSDAQPRSQRALDLLERAKPTISLETYFQVLRDHGEGAAEQPNWTPATGITGMTLCAHMGFGPIRIDQTVGSMVAQLSPKGNTFWVTCSAAPCTSIYKPVWIDAGIPDEPCPTDTFDGCTRWWRHEQLHRSVMRDYASRLSIYAHERDTMEQYFIQEAQVCLDAPVDVRRELSQRIFAEADAATLRWTNAVREKPKVHPAPFLHQVTWKLVNKDSHLPAN